jgi:hypothetical protein
VVSAHLRDWHTSGGGGSAVRHLQPKVKDRRKVPIPDELQDSLRGVCALIEQARRDPGINLGFAGAIQIGAVRGGRFGTKRRPFVLTYDPAGDVELGRWFLTLHGIEVEDIGDGVMTDMTMYCCTGPGCRRKFREAVDHCIDCDYVEAEQADARPSEDIQKALDDQCGESVQDADTEIYYWRDCARYLDDGSIRISASFYECDESQFSHSSGWVDIAPNDPDYGLWRWMIAQTNRMDQIIGPRDLKANRERYRREVSP